MARRKHFGLTHRNGAWITTERGRETAISYSTRRSCEYRVNEVPNQRPIVRSLLRHRNSLPAEVHALGSALHPRVGNEAGQVPPDPSPMTKATGLATTLESMASSTWKRRV